MAKLESCAYPNLLTMLGKNESPKENFHPEIGMEIEQGNVNGGMHIKSWSQGLSPLLSTGISAPPLELQRLRVVECGSLQPSGGLCPSQ